MHSWDPGTPLSHLVTRPAPRFGSGRGPSASPTLAGLPRPPFQREHPCPFLPKPGPGSHRPAEDGRWGSHPSRASCLRGEPAGPWPVTIEGRLSGGPWFLLNVPSGLWPRASLSPRPLRWGQPPALSALGMWTPHSPERPLCKGETGTQSLGRRAGGLTGWGSGGRGDGTVGAEGGAAGAWWGRAREEGACPCLSH